MKQSSRFLEYLDVREWPVEMEILRQNLLCTTKFDAELDQAQDEVFAILPSLLQRATKFPALASMLDAKWSAKKIG